MNLDKYVSDRPLGNTFTLVIMGTHIPVTEQYLISVSHSERRDLLKILWEADAIFDLDTATFYFPG